MTRTDRPVPEKPRNRPSSEEIRDPHELKARFVEPTVCTECAAVYRQGRWAWAPRPADAQETTCPACHRIKDGFAAAEANLKGAFVRRYKAEILHLARNTEAAEMAEHPLHRIVDVNDTADGVSITTTDIHLPRRIAVAAQNAYDGELIYLYDKDTFYLRIHWVRE